MSRAIVLTTAALLGICFFGYLGIAYLGEKNGGLAILYSLVDGPGAPLYDYPDKSGRRIFTGVKAVDRVLTLMVRFFHPMGTGNSPPLSLFTVVSAGQGLAAHTILLLEGERSTFWAGMYQIIPFGIWIPIYCIVHIWTSPVSRLSTVSDVARKIELLVMDPLQLAAMPGALVMGFLVPTALIGWPGLLSLDTNQVVIALWQVFPVWTALWLFGIAVFLKAFGVVPGSAYASPAAKLRYARWTYRAVLVLTAAIHLSCLWFTFFPQHLNSLLPNLDTSSITLASVFIPMPIFPSRNIRDFYEAVITLMHYDIYSGAAAILVFALYQVYVSFDGSASAVTNMAIKSVWRSALVGPAGAALWALGDRDAQLIEDAATQDPKKTQ
ncbi:hypothetical protein ACHAQA_006970 [Verticillium albo-atrum]